MITCEGIASFVNVFQPSEDLSGNMKYSIMFLVDKSDKAGVKALENEVARAVERGKEKKWGGKKPKFRYEALRDGDEELDSGDKTGEEYKGRIFLSAKCNGSEGSRPPGVVGPDAQPLMDQSALYSGCKVRLDVSAYPYKNGGNAGVAWGLNNVMLVDDGERLDGRMNAADAFKDYQQEQEQEQEQDDSLA